MKKPLREFSWSAAREELFRECPRAYYFRYYAAWGGWDGYADPECREIYRLSKQKIPSALLTECLGAALRNTFIRPGSPEKNDFQRLLFREFRKSNIAGYEHGTLKMMEATVSTWAKTVPETPLYTRLSALGTLHFREFRRPAHFICGGIKVWCAPALVWMEDRYCISLNTAWEHSRENWALRAAIDRMLCSNMFRIPPERCLCLTVFFGENSFPGTYYSLSRGHSAQIIERGIEDMLTLSENETVTHINRFQKRESRKTCPQCRFFTVCSSG